MAEIKFYRMLLNQNALYSFLKEKKLIFDSEMAAEMGIQCRNINCSNRTRGFRDATRKRKLSEQNRSELNDQGQDIINHVCLRCKACKTTLSPKTWGFFCYQDCLDRANVKIAPEKILQIIYHWCLHRSIEDSVISLNLTKNTIVDWQNFCRGICSNANHGAHLRLMGDSENQRRIDIDLPRVVIQIDETLLRGKRQANRGRLLLGDNPITREERDEYRDMIGEENAANPVRNYGRRIEGPWIFGLVECTFDGETSYKSGEVRLYKVERRDAATLIPIIRQNVAPGSTIWSDEWPAYNQIGQNDGLIHETVNHSVNFVSTTGVHTQNIERLWQSLKARILKQMNGTNSMLLQSHLEEFMWRSRQNSDPWTVFNSIIDEIALQNPITI